MGSGFYAQLHSLLLASALREFAGSAAGRFDKLLPLYATRGVA